jgi:hypothetical protein
MHNAENQVAEFQTVEKISENVEFIWQPWQPPAGVRCQLQGLGDSQVVCTRLGVDRFSLVYGKAISDIYDF